MIFDKIFFKVLKIKWVLMKVVGTVGTMGGVGVVGIVGGVGIMGAVGGASCTGDLWVVGVLRETQKLSGFLERGLKIEIKNFAKGVAVKLLKPLAKFSNNERKNLF